MNAKVLEMLTKHIEVRAAEYKALKEEKKAIEKRLEALQDEILSGLARNGVDLKNDVKQEFGRYTVSYKHVYSVGIDTNALKTNDWYEDLKAAYPKHTHSKRFTIK